MTKNVVLLTSLLFTGVVHSVQAQPFRVGDYVEANYGNQWIPCRVITPLQNNGYGVSCGIYDLTPMAVPQSIRARTPTAEDKRVEAETAAALAHLPRPGNGPGAQYGTREPTTCATRTAPAKGAPSADQARQYVICDSESVYGSSLFLVTSVKVQVAPVSHPPNQLVKQMRGDIDPSQPVWDIRGSFTQYQCSQTGPSQNPFARTHNCSVSDLPAAAGYCYKNTFGDWHCSMIGALANARQLQLPPEGN